MFIKYNCLIFFIVFIKLSSEELLQVNGKIWGPGLYPDKIVMPARYFFMKLYNHHTNETIDPTKVTVEVQGYSADNRPSRIWTQVLVAEDRFIIRYKLYQTCRNLRIDIKYENEPIEESPIIINKIVYSEDCYCPIGSISKWLNVVDCGSIPNQVNRDLKPFSTINWDKIRKEVIMKYDSPGSISICHYVTKDNNIYRNCYGKYVGFKMFMDSILLSLSRKMYLPDMEFFVNLGDWPLSKNINYPIFSWCGSTDTYDIIMPTYDISESTLENMGRVTLDMLSIQGNTNKKWVDRKDQCFWRGRDSNRKRLNLIDISKKYPDLFNASLTNFFFFRDEQEKYGPKSDHISFFDFFEYKYQVNIDGTVAAYRFPYLLAGGSLVLKQESKYYEHFYNDLTPGVHYIPLNEDLTDLVSQVKWAREYDSKAKKIAEEAKEFANRNLLPKNIFCYYAHLFNEYSSKIKNKINVWKDMEKVGQPEQSAICDCQSSMKDEL